MTGARYSQLGPNSPVQQLPWMIPMPILMLDISLPRLYI
jgi:hypothetical protein